VFSAKGAAFNRQPGAAPQDSWLHGTSAESAIHYRIASQAWRYFDEWYVLGLETIRRIEARFQRLVYRTIGFLGRCPRLA
jgi:hypothetical protein